MTRSRLDPGPDRPTLRVRGPADLLQAVPYLLGFHPHTSLVLIGLEASRLVVTVRIDLLDLATAGVLSDAVAAMVRGGATDIVGAVYDDEGLDRRFDTSRDDTGSGAGAVPNPLPWRGVAEEVTAQAELAGCTVLDLLFVADGRWWSYGCACLDCCPPEGRPLPEVTSVFAAEATYAGMVALPDRTSLAAVLEPRPTAERERLATVVAQSEQAVVQAALEGKTARQERSVTRALFAAARAADTPGEATSLALDDATVARFGVALRGYPVRDSLWMAVDDGRVDGRQLWRELAARLPSPYDAAASFLFAWGTWRDGNGALARIAAERAIESDPGYSAADLLLAALNRGVDPRTLPRLRVPRSG